jgi:hypothetical protein
MDFLQTSAGKAVALVVVLAIVVIAVFVLTRSSAGGTDSPSDVSKMLPPSDSNGPTVHPRPGDAAGVTPGGATQSTGGR